MPPADHPHGSPSRSQLPRRAVVAAGAWTVPVVAAATAAPAFAASPCSTDYSYLVNWGNAAAQFSRTSASAATATATSTGGQAMSIGFASALIGAASGYTLDPTYNLTVPGPSAGGAAPNVTNLGNIVSGGSERGLCLQHSTSTTASVNGTGLPDRGQRLTITFPRAVTGLAFWLVDIDSTTNGYWDRVRFTTVAPTVVPGSPSANINGTGYGTTPFRYSTTQTNSNIDENTANARVRVQFAGPITTLVMEYWNASYISGSSIQRVFLHDLAFTAKGC